MESDEVAGLWITRENYEDNREYYDNLPYELHFIDDEVKGK